MVAGTRMATGRGDGGPAGCLAGRHGLFWFVLRVLCHFGPNAYENIGLFGGSEKPLQIPSSLVGGGWDWVVGLHTFGPGPPRSSVEAWTLVYPVRGYHRVPGMWVLVILTLVGFMIWCTARGCPEQPGSVPEPSRLVSVVLAVACFCCACCWGLCSFSVVVLVLGRTGWLFGLRA